MSTVARGRSGPFWDAVAARRPVPPAAATLGFDVVDADVELGTIEFAFEATEAFTTPRADVLEGRLDATFVRPAFPGRLVGSGRVVHRDTEIAILEGSVADPSGDVVATATAVARVVGFHPATTL